jgi:hypothetical protein
MRLEELMALNQNKKKQEEKLRKVFNTQAVNEQYNLSEAAGVLGVHRQMLYYWIKKSWLKPMRDRRNYPVFTVLDIQRLKKWRGALKKQNSRSCKKDSLTINKESCSSNG